MAETKKPRPRAPEPRELLDDEAGAVQIGPTDQGMVRIILTTQAGVFELDFPPEEAREIAEELTAAAEMCGGAPRKSR